MIALTGYTGFVGGHLLNKLEGSKCLLLGRNQNNHQHDFQYFDLSDLSQTLNLKGVSVLVHCAARVHIMNDNSQNPLEEFRRSNTLATLNLAKQAAAAGVKRFVFLSSIKVNGESTTDRNPYKSSDNPAPKDAYGQSKAEAECELFELGKSTGMEIVIIRPPLVYGKGVKANFASLLNLVNKGIPLPFRCIKNNRRSLVSVYNLVDLITICIKHPKAANQVFLVSDDHDISTSEMVKLMAWASNNKNLMLPIPVSFFKFAGKLLNKNDIIDRLTGSLELDIQHTKNTLAWTPPFSIKESFVKTIKTPSTDKL
tara:strand:+ start:1966 stop:2901 length:936 start_codon:yes stop_codon:yes gene_type:complete